MYLLKLRPTLFSSPQQSPFRSSSFKPNSLSPPSSSVQYSAWSGLQAWREGPINEDRRWGPSGPEPPPPSPPQAHPSDGPATAASLAELGAMVLSTSDPLAKSRLSHYAYSRWRREKLPLGAAEPPPSPARADKPDLVRALLILEQKQRRLSFGDLVELFYGFDGLGCIYYYLTLLFH